MTTKRHLALLCSFAFGGLLLAAGDAWAQAAKTTFTGTETTVFFGDPIERHTGRMTHYLGMHNTNERTDVEGTDEWKVVGGDGIGEHKVNLKNHIDEATGNGTFSGTSMIIPGDDVAGIWECTVGRGQLRGGVGRGQAVCQGTGVFEGQQLRVRTDGGALTGWILTPASTSMAPVPEPTTFTLALLSIVFLGGWRWRS